MGILELLFGARKPKPTGRNAVTFDEIDVGSEYSQKSIASARNNCRGNQWSDLEAKLRRLQGAGQKCGEVDRLPCTMNMPSTMNVRTQRVPGFASPPRRGAPPARHQRPVRVTCLLPAL